MYLNMNLKFYILWKYGFVIKILNVNKSLYWHNVLNNIGEWGLGIGDWAQSPIPNPQSPIPNFQYNF